MREREMGSRPATRCSALRPVLLHGESLRRRAYLERAFQSGHPSLAGNS
jgi:hypothetical protein